jgi:hypothetical protein
MMATTDQIWDKLLEIVAAVGDAKVAIATCAANVKAQAEIVALLAAHVKESNGTAAEVMRRLTAIELASACDHGEQKGARRQWRLIAGALAAGAAGAAILTSIGFIGGWW